MLEQFSDWLSQSWGWIAAAAAGLILLNNATGVVTKLWNYFMKPHKDLDSYTHRLSEKVEEQFAENKKDHDNIYRILGQDQQALEDLKSENRTLLDILYHYMSGDPIQQRQALAALHEYLIQDKIGGGTNLPPVDVKTIVNGQEIYSEKQIMDMIETVLNRQGVK